MIRAVCFDLDGTLGGYAGDFGGLMAMARTELGLERCDMNRFTSIVQQELTSDGPLDLTTALERTLERLEQRPPPGLEDVAASITARYASEVRPAPGAAQLLEPLDGSRVWLGLVTNGPVDMQRASLGALGFEKRFRVVIVSGDRDVAARKPSRRVFGLACTGLATLPEETLMVGDDPVVDVRGALDYGMQAVLVGSDRDGRELGVASVGGMEPLAALLRSRYGL